MRHAKRVDANHASIRDALKSKGFDVMDLSGAGDGIPDLCVMIAPGRSHFLEIKDGKKAPSARKLTEAQERWQLYCGEITTKVCNLDEAVEALTWAVRHVEQ